MRKFLALITVLTCVFAPTLAMAQAVSPFPFIHNCNLQTSAAATGGGTVCDTGHISTVVFQALHTSGTTTLTFQGSLDNTNWTTLASCYALGSTSPISTLSVSTTPQMVRCNVQAISSVRANITTCTACVGVTVKAFGTSIPLSSTLE